MTRFRVFAFALLTSVLVIRPATAQQDVITTLIGGGPNGVPAIDANVDQPIGVAIDAFGNYYIGAYDQHRAFKVNVNGTLTVLAGTGVAGYAGDGVTGGAANALLNGPTGTAVDAQGNVYIADYNSCVIRKVDTTNTITTVAGVSGSCGFNGDGAPATSFFLRNIWGITVDHSGNLFVADSGNCRIRKLVLATGTISTFAGTGSCGYSGDGGLATAANLNSPGGVAVDNAGNVYIADTNNYRVREVNTAGTINTIAGTGSNGFAGDGGPALTAKIGQVENGITVDPAGTTVTIAEYNNERIRQFSIGGNINTIAGKGSSGFCGDGAAALQACFTNPSGLAVTSGGTIYVADRSNDRVRAFTIGGNINTASGNGSTNLPTLISGVPPSGVVFNYPWDVLVDPLGNVFVSDQNDCVVRELLKSTNLVNIFAGTGVCGYAGDGGSAVQAKLNKTYGVGRDSVGNIYVADTLNHIVRQIDTSGTITTFAGQPNLAGYTGDGGPATSAKLNSPYGVFVDPANNVYIADTNNHVIRKVTGGVITTFAGNGHAGFAGDGDPATVAELNSPYGVTTDQNGNVYIADSANCRVRAVPAATGTINTVAGTGACNFNGDGLATTHNLSTPRGILADSNGNIFIADTYNQRVRWVDLSGNMTTIAGNGTAGYTGDGGTAFSAELYYPSGIGQDPSGNFLIADQYNFRVRGVSVFSALNTSASSLAFGAVAIGGSSSYQTVRLSAVGPLTIGNIQTTGDFSEFDNCGSGLANGKSCTVYVAFKPKAAGARSGALTIQDNGFFSQSTTIALSGTGNAISVSGGPLAFDNQLSKTVSAPLTITVTNKSAGGITFGAVGLTESTDFGITANTCPAAGHVLAGAASCTINVVFKPQSTGQKKGALTIADNDPSSPQVVGMSGNGYSNVSLSPATVNFPVQAVGTTTLTSSALKVTLTNNTGAALTLGNPAVTITGPFSALGATSCTNNLVVAASGTCVIYLVFAPTAVGYPTGILSVKDSDATSPQTVALTGTATGVLFAPTSLNLGTSTVGRQVSSTVTITNVGSTFITFAGWQITGTNAKDFSTNSAFPPCGGSLAPGAPCTFTMYFTPSVTGTESANFLVYNNSPGSPQVLPLTGTGQ